MEHLLTSRATIRRYAADLNDGPEPTATLSIVAADVPCRVMQRSERELGGLADPGIAGHSLMLPYGTDLNRSDMVVVDGVTYEVELVNVDPGARRSHVSARVKEVR